MKAARSARLATASLLLISACALAQPQEHVAWTAQAEPGSAAPGSKILLKIDGQIASGWHLYSASTAAGIPTSFKVGPESIVQSQRILQPPPKRAFDKTFDAETETYEGSASFLVELQLKKDAPAGAADLTIQSRYQTCNDEQCFPGKWSGSAPLKVDPAAPAATLTIPAAYAEAHPPAQPSQGGTPASDQSQGLAAFLLVAFGFGLASVFTPCVFPMIPITMSYFLNRQSGGRRDSITQAVVFCLGIVVLFSGLGLMMRVLLGPFGIVQLGSNPWVNGFITLLFMAFGLSLLGAFEITIPSSILTRLNKSSEQGGFAGTLLMGLTFSLASFACVGPFVGTLLAASVGGSPARPILGMVTFASGLALPFLFLAMFPSYLKRMPRSGGWLARVKVVMGFVILAFSLKYLSSLDQVLHWNVLTRERFLAAWIVLFAMAGLYLLGFVRLEGIKQDESMGLGRLLVGIVFLVFAISLTPGMFGGRLGDLDAYVPVASGDAPSLAGGGSTASGTTLSWMKNQYREALDIARREGKLVFVNFTGYGCANCHWMKANMFTRPEIAAAMKDFVLVDLYADGTDPESEANQKLELEKFQTIAEPYYAILDPNEKVIATFDRKTSDSAEYLAFLQKGAKGAAPAAVQSTQKSDGDLPHVNRLEGGALDTAALNGKVVVVNFWATWCVPCIGEIPSFNKVSKEYAPKGVEMIGVSMDEDGAPLVQSFLKKHPIDYTVALGSADITEQFKLDELPVTLIYDRTGKQIKRMSGRVPEADLRAAIQAAL